MTSYPPLPPVETWHDVVIKMPHEGQRVVGWLGHAPYRVVGEVVFHGDGFSHKFVTDGGISVHCSQWWPLPVNLDEKIESLLARLKDAPSE
jgi:hypothetical protein